MHLDAGLSEAERATAFFVRKLVEEQLYWQIKRGQTTIYLP